MICHHNICMREWHDLSTMYVDSACTFLTSTWYPAGSTSIRPIVEQSIFRIIVEQNGIIKVRANKISCPGARASFELAIEF